MEKRKSGGTSVTFAVRYIWNDLIDPNHKYKTDTLKAVFGKVVSLGQSKDYRISISWTVKATIAFKKDGTLDDSACEGWPFARS